MDRPPLQSEVIRDRDGDLWLRHKPDKRFRCITDTDQMRRTLEEIQRDFGPVQRAEWQDA